MKSNVNCLAWSLIVDNMLVEAFRPLYFISYISNELKKEVFLRWKKSAYLSW